MVPSTLDQFTEDPIIHDVQSLAWDFSEAHIADGFESFIGFTYITD